MHLGQLSGGRVKLHDAVTVTFRFQYRKPARAPRRARIRRRQDRASDAARASPTCDRLDGAGEAGDEEEKAR
jgi:hypothetical protein